MKRFLKYVHVISERKDKSLTIDQWIVDGYSTMMAEIDTQLGGNPPTLVVTPVGVGSFAQAVVSHSKAAGRGTRVLAVEPDTAACLWKSLSQGCPTQIKTSHTIMTGMNCGTVSDIAWPVLKSGLDMSVTVSDLESHKAVQDLLPVGIMSGPCGASTLAALRRVYESGNFPDIGLTEDSVVVLLSTEGSRDYEVPLDVKTEDPAALTQALVHIDSANPDLSMSRGAEENGVGF